MLSWKPGDLGLIIVFICNKLCTLKHDFNFILCRAVYIVPGRLPGTQQASGKYMPVKLFLTLAYWSEIGESI